MTFHPYLFFGGSCRDAFTRYHEIFGGDLVLLSGNDVPPGTDPPPGDPNLIMHAALTFDDTLLMASDDPTADGPVTVQGIQVNCAVKTVDEAKRIFEALAEGGTVTAPLEETFFSPAFGMCVDRFGTPWMISTEGPH